MIGVVDYGAGNLASVGYALDRLGERWQVVARPGDLDEIDEVVFPGVGAAGPAMAKLAAAGLDAALIRYLEAGGAYLGICLGLQLLFSRSAEDGAEGLGVMTGEVVRLPTSERLPHVGWSPIEAAPSSRLLASEDGQPFYFTHSYAVEPREQPEVAAWASHGCRFVCAVERGRLFGVQFHPERSGPAGARLLARFLALSRGA